MATYKKGSKGTEVVNIQKALTSLGYSVGVADGIFGAKTEQAILSLQKSIKIDATGVVGDWLYNYLLSKLPKTSSKGVVITVTAGHNDKDPGAVNGKYTEANIVTEMRDIVVGKLEAKGYTVLTDGAKGENQTLSKAVLLVPKSKLAVELHLNASSNKSAGGIEALAKTKDKKFCQDLCNLTSTVLGNKVRGSDGGWKAENSGQHTRLAFVSAGGVIFEGFFISNETELAKYLSNKDAFCNAIVKAIELNV